jgi:hypothetical protein
MTDEGPSPLLVIVLVAIVVIAGAAAGILVYVHSRPHSGPTLFVVVEGDNVTVNYIGLFGSGPDQGHVFDTSLYTVAQNSAVWPKSLEYEPRPSAANYTPLPVHVGASTPSSGYSLGGQNFIQVVTGFWQGLIGLPGNVSRAVSVPDSLGYGAANPACEETLPISETVPVVEFLTTTGFGNAYPGVQANTGATFKDPNYGWPVLILSANSTGVVIENLPTVGFTASPAGWPVVVTNVTSTANGSGSITLVNQIDPSQAGHLVGYDFAGNGPCRSQTGGDFIVSSVDLAAGTYVANFNTEVTGQTLIFIVTVVDIYPA